MLSLYITWHFVTIYTVSKSTFTITSVYHLMFLFYFRHIHFHSTIFSHQAIVTEFLYQPLKETCLLPAMKKHKGGKLTFSFFMNVFLKSLDFYSNFHKEVWLCEWVIKSFWDVHSLIDVLREHSKQKQQSWKENVEIYQKKVGQA